MKTYTLAAFIASIVIVLLFIGNSEPSDNTAVFLNSQIGRNYEASLFTDRYGEPIATFDRGDFWEAHYEFKITNPEIYQETGYVGIVVRISGKKVVGWTQILD